MSSSYPTTPKAFSRTLVSAFLAGSFFFVSPSFANGDDELLASFSGDIEPILDQYCYDCHGYGSDKGGVVLDGFTNDLELRDHGLWLRALKNIRSGLMPPADEAQLPAEKKQQVMNWIKGDAFELDPNQPDPGRLTIRRLNRVEYRNTIKDLLDYDYDTAVEFPSDDTGHGFDNIGDVLTISPMLLEKYLDAAQTIISEAVPQSSRVVAEHAIGGKFFVSANESVEEGASWVKQLSYYDPLVVSSRHEVEIAGGYEVAIDLMAVETYVNNQFDLNECRFIFKIDGETVLDRTFVREGWKSFEYAYQRHWEPGTHEFTIEIQPLTPDAEKIRDLRIQLNNVYVRGPFAEEHYVEPRDYRKFFPKEAPAAKRKRAKYARELIEDFASRAYRRPVDEYSLERLVSLALYSESQEGETFESGISRAYVAVLASPRFLFREEEVEAPVANEAYANIDEYSLASRLSYFLWSTMPDEELFSLAAEGRLREQLEPQVKRMLKHPKAKEFVSNFVGQWLQARDIGTVPISNFAIWLRENPDPELAEARATFRRIREIREENRTEEEKEQMAEARKIFFASFRIPKPDLSSDLRRAMLEESELVFEHILQEDRSFVELIDSDYTFLNEKLAEHYGITGVDGDKMRKVQLSEDSARGGVLTQGTVLAVTSNPTRTSPVKRGVFILDNILGMPPPPPPPNIPSLEDAASEAELAEMSLRETLELHAKKRACRSCHSRMDPLGLALENFNAMGAWREEEMNQPIEPEGQLITGERFADIRDLKTIIANERREDFYHCLTEKLLTYALGRGLEYYDVDTVDHLVESLNESDGKPSTLIMGIIESAPFQKRRINSSSETEALAQDSRKASELADI
ncbi:conserved hypothetical protein [Verrucomicrobiia bacterium DG1235]|nr:conserved hypothetical protein [Verrucomicrobiae bacterium DG1235]